MNLIELSMLIYFGKLPILVSAYPDNSNYLNVTRKSIKTQQKGVTCMHPDMPVFPADVSMLERKPTARQCDQNQFDWVTVVNRSKCKVTAQAKRTYSNIVCQYTDLIQETDFHIKAGKTTYLDADHEYHLQASDTVEVKCHAQHQAKWQSTLIGVRDTVELKAKPNLDPGMLNVLMFGFDSMSHNAFIRQLPKTYKYLTKVMDAQVLNGYNIVGDGTYKAMLHIFTGQTESDLPDVAKGSKNHPDILPFVWKNFEAKGYITGLLEDMPFWGTFQYRTNGFLKQPTHHIMRTYYTKNPQEHCIGPTPQFQTFLNQLDRILQAYKKKRTFIYSFHGMLSHPVISRVRLVDEDVKLWLSRLKWSGVLNNTFFMFMADHGSRYSKARNTYYGRLEERLPFFSIIVPKWFQSKYPLAYQNLRKNKGRLTSPYDIYSTLKHILDLKDFHPGTLKEHSISLFREIPANRTCADALIGPHWCACSIGEPISKDDVLLKTLGEALITKLNSLTSHVREFCEPLKLKKIYWASKSKQVGNTKEPIRSQYYLILLETLVNRGTYEATVSYINGTYTVKKSDISRTNEYGTQAKCIEKKFPQLRKYCYCKKNAKKTVV